MSWETIFASNLGPDDAAAWGRLVRSLREVQDGVASMSFDRGTVDALADDLGAWADKLEPLSASESEQVNGRVPTLPVRGHAMLPELRVTSAGGGRVDGTVSFGRWFMGGGMAAHGGAITLLFDEALGILASVTGKAITRTAYLRTDFRALTPLDTELQVSAWVERIEDRKIFLRGEIRHGSTVCAEADGLFLRLRPEQGLGHRTDGS
ncbi:PaaI family thioesterase [Aeromicrobium sp. Leaf350]|uniref:PaaI family thioesterase n=1 Tax=Aeromicrobium sp. Leaf350 TaxID=2876565 RepID=UPI001E41CF43|nr:hotdog domain-containing protein [Aeromicrobium sp. Leaf350]